LKQRREVVENIGNWRKTHACPNRRAATGGGGKGKTL